MISDAPIWKPQNLHDFPVADDIKIFLAVKSPVNCYEIHKTEITKTSCHYVKQNQHFVYNSKVDESCIMALNMSKDLELFNSWEVLPIIVLLE